MYCYSNLCFNFLYSNSRLLIKSYNGFIRHSSLFKKDEYNEIFIFSYNQLLKILFSFNTKKIINVLYYNPVCLIFTGFSISPLLIHSFFSLNVVPNQLNWVEPLVLSGFVLTLLISFKSLKFLGEPERYLEFIYNSSIYNAYLCSYTSKYLF